MADDTKVDFYFYYHSNHLGSTNFVTRVAKSEDEDKPRHEMYEHVEYIPFGETWIEEREVLPFGASKSNRYLFTSKEFDQETRLYYYGARYYDPKTSLWLNADPILGSYLTSFPNGGVGNSFNLNLYAYTYQNPIKHIDPDGTTAKINEKGEVTNVWKDPEDPLGVYKGDKRIGETLFWDSLKDPTGKDKASVQLDKDGNVVVG